MVRRVSIGLVLAFFVISLLCWAYAGSVNTFNVINQLQGTLADSIPLILGALAGCLCERSGVINIAIEGQLLLGAFAGAVFASAFGVLWLGLIAGSLAGRPGRAAARHLRDHLPGRPDHPRGRA